MVDTYNASELAERAFHRRAIEAVVWGIPAVNYELLYRSLTRLGGSWNQVAYWSRLPDWKNQTLTPNPDVIYVFPFYNTVDGPIVIEIPPAGEEGSITGSIDDAWQIAIEDVGPAGVDKGAGGKYLILPPGYSGEVPNGFLAFRSQTYAGYLILRSNPASGSDEDIAKAAAYGRRVRMYPLGAAANPPETQFFDAIDSVYENIIPFDASYFELLDQFVQREPWLERDKALIDTLKTIGIEKGRSFAPNEKTSALLEGAAKEAGAWLDSRYDAVYDEPYFNGTRWAVPAPAEVIKGMQTGFGDPNSYPLADRGLLYSYVYFSAKHLGAGQFYVMTIKDGAGRSLDGGATYRLTVPANPPVSLYWSATVYDRATHAVIRGKDWSSRSTHSPELQSNADGSIDVWFAPTAPESAPNNWVPTDPNGEFEVLFRFYGPQKPLFEKTWTLPDIEKVS